MDCDRDCLLISGNDRPPQFVPRGRVRGHRPTKGQSCRGSAKSAYPPQILTIDGAHVGVTIAHRNSQRKRFGDLVEFGLSQRYLCGGNVFFEIGAAFGACMKLRLEYWEKVKDIEPKNLVFLDETGVLLGLSRTHARSQLGTRAYAVKPFYRGKKVTVIGAISLTQ